MNHTVLHRTPLDVAGARAAGLARLPFAEGLFRTKAATATLESRDLETPFGFDDLVGSLTADVPAGGEVELSVKVRLETGWTEWFSLGTLRDTGWTSPLNALGAAGTVDVDTLKLDKKASAFRYRLKFKAGKKAVRLRSVAVAVSDGQSPDAPPAFSPGPWVRDLGLFPRSQGDAQEKYKHDICAPTSLAMVLEYWGLKKNLEEVALAAQDRGSRLFGNWPANVAYAGSLGLEGHVARLESLADAEAEIARGRPVIVSVTFDEGELPNAPMAKTRGHVLVIGGFTPEGDIIAYDPAGPGRDQVRRVYARAAFHRVWRVNKRGLAYRIGPAFPREFTIGTPVADLWARPVRRARVKLDDEAHLSQILYGETVTALEAKGEWVRVRADEQEIFRPAGGWQGYPGWIKAETLVCTAPPQSGPVVRVRQALLQRGDDLLTLSVGTRLSRISEKGGAAVVRLLDGTLAEIPSDSLYAAPAQPTAASRAEIIRTAELFLGTSYYWGGRSGVQPDPSIGVDCSGLVSLAYRIHGRDVPRDSHEQKLHARAVRRAHLESGDLVFLTDDETSERVTHVMIFTGGDGLIESRKSSGRVLRTTFLERFGRALPAIESGDAVSDLSFARPRRRRLFFGSYFQSETAKKPLIHFVGIGGAGMSALAQIHALDGGPATGSDRDFDRGRSAPLRAKLEALGVRLFAQDGSALTRATDLVVLSTAIEDANPEIAAAKALGVPLMHRSEFLARHVSRLRTVAVTGTSGKSTVVAMIFEILEAAGRGPSVITGGSLLALERRGLNGNAWRGKSELLVIEADESDGSLVNYKPAVGVFLNLTKDHLEVAALRDIFLKFRANVATALINSDDPELAALRADGTFGLESGSVRGEGLELGPNGSQFRVRDTPFHLPLPGRHNAANAVAAVAACLNEGVSLADCSRALASFQGVARRFQSLGTARGVEVVDDFAHNPAKIAATLTAARLRARRILAVYQPHGFAPTRHLKNELIEAFAQGLRPDDRLWLPDIYYVGGTASKDISSSDVVEPLRAQHLNAFHVADRSEIIGLIAAEARAGDLVLVMGARDPSLADFARAVLAALLG